MIFIAQARVIAFMCTLVLQRTLNHPWPVILGANRDERITRPWRPPARHWPDRPNIVGGLDLSARGTWLAVNDEGVLAAVLNQPQTLGPERTKRSRGELPLEALGHADAYTAAGALCHIEPHAYRPFHLLIADAQNAYLLSSDGQAPVRAQALSAGLSMVTAHGLNAHERSARVRTYLPRFAQSPLPDPQSGDWADWKRLLACPLFEAETGPEGAMNVHGKDGFATVSSSLIALPERRDTPSRPLWIFAKNPNDVASYGRVSLDP